MSYVLAAPMCSCSIIAVFDQQIHMWRWTGNETHASLLRPALALHAEWAGDCFDGDANGLYQSYINTWPTDSVWYNGGETAEETAYMLRTHAALRDLATLAGNATDAALHASIVARITSAFPSLWVTEEGHPAAFREEGGHQRLRPDAWLYSIFLPIEASLLSPAQAAQALFYTEWGLERDAILPCDDGSTNCGEVVWVSRTCLRVETFTLALCCLVAIRPPTGYLPCGACASYGPGTIMPWHRRTSLQGCLTMALLFWKETCGEICC